MKSPDDLEMMICIDNVHVTITLYRLDAMQFCTKKVNVLLDKRNALNDL